MPALYKPNRIKSLVTGQAVPGNAGVWIAARMRNQAGALVTQASLSTIAYDIVDVQAYLDSGDDVTMVASGTSLTISSVIYDSLQQPSEATSLWTKDGPGNLGPDKTWGYTFATVIGASNFTVARSGHTFRIQVLFTPTSGEQFRITYEVPTLKVFSSSNLS